MEDRGRGCPSLKQLNEHVLQKAAVKWRYIGIQLSIDGSALDIIKENHKQDVHHIEECCYEMFKKWLETCPNPSWNQLLEALRSSSVELLHLASQIEQELNSPPVVTHHPTSSSDVPVGRSITLTCGASGLGTVVYSWERSSGSNWTSVSNDNTTSYTTDTTLAIGQYMYRCRVSNEAGSVVSNVATMNVYSPPVIIHHPTSSSDVPVGRSITLTCRAIGLGTVVYSWERSSGSNWTTVSNDNTTSYTTDTTLAIGQYMYRCRVSNEAGSVVSNIATVNVYGPPVVTHHPTSSSDVPVGKTITLTCEASGLGTVVYSWERSSGSNWTTVSNDNTTSYTTDTTLAIGQYLYWCRVSNELGSVVSNIAIVNMYGPPVVTHHPTSSSDVPVGRSITLTCRASGLGTVVYSWERSSGGNWTVVSNDYTTSYTTDTTLAIGQYIYRCRVSNEAGSVVSNIATVNVYDVSLAYSILNDYNSFNHTTSLNTEDQQRHTMDIVKKGKDCLTVAKNALDDIGSGREEMALRKLSALQNDGIFLADTAKRLAERLEAANKFYQQKDAEILHEISELSRRESELKDQKSKEEIQLAEHQNAQQDNQIRLCCEENKIQDAEKKLRKAKETEKDIQLKSTFGGALLGLLARKVGVAEGAAAGAGIGVIINNYRKEEKDAQDEVDRCRNDLDSARSAVNEGQKRISNVESQITSLDIQINHIKLLHLQLQTKHLQLQKEIDKVRVLIDLAKRSVTFWLMFEQISEHGVVHTTFLQKIITMAAETVNYQSKGNTFIEAWEQMTMECKGSNHTPEIEYK